MRTFTVDDRHHWDEQAARAELRRFEGWLRCGPPGRLEVGERVPRVLAEALRDVALGAGAEVETAQRIAA